MIVNTQSKSPTTMMPQEYSAKPIRKQSDSLTDGNQSVNVGASKSGSVSILDAVTYKHRGNGNALSNFRVDKLKEIHSQGNL